MRTRDANASFAFPTLLLWAESSRLYNHGASRDWPSCDLVRQTVEREEREERERERERERRTQKRGNYCCTAVQSGCNTTQLNRGQNSDPMVGDTAPQDEKCQPQHVRPTFPFPARETPRARSGRPSPPSGQCRLSRRPHPLPDALPNLRRGCRRVLVGHQVRDARPPRVGHL